jgi:cell fate regulator YaaT (PSP1 superfamily)
MKMAKSQKTTLDPTKISGRCGRLMCCLRFEDKTYEDLRRKLPKKGSRVVTARGKGEVVDYDILAQLVTIETDKDKRMVIPVSEIIGKGNSSREGAGGGKG